MTPPHGAQGQYPLPVPAPALCRKCKRPVKATPFGVGHAVTFARTCAVDWHRAVA
jgi:hypothetical protein